jgi:NAD(P)-dependent dehydrogenase (short-subunit alcohol dehydrogenase family)
MMAQAMEMGERVASLSDKLNYDGRRVLITGAAGGIGSALARSFAGAGASLSLADRNSEGLAQLAAELPAGTRTHVFDQGDAASMEALAAEAGPVDVLINNAGALLVKPVLDSTPQEMLELVRINLVGPMVLTRLFGAGMLARGSGVILNMSSQLAFCGAEGRSVYATAKAGLAQFTKSAAVEFGRQGVRVLAIAPGRLLTAMTTTLGSPEAYKAGIARVPVGRYGTPEEIADIILFLCSPAADYVVGETLIADGGYVIG